MLNIYHLGQKASLPQLDFRGRGLDAPFVVLACTGSILLGLRCARLCALKILIFFNQGLANLSGNTGTANGLHCNNLIQETKTSNSDNTTNPINGQNFLSN